MGQARRFTLLWYHTYDSRRCEPGFPDLVLVKDRVLFRELKTDKGLLTKEQADWGERFIKSRADWEIWRPTDMPKIVKELTR